MSLDFVLVKAKGVVNSIGELEQDSSFSRANYKAYAEQLFPGLIWQADDTAIVGGAGMFIEVSLSDATLHLGLRGRGDILTAISKIAVEAAMAGIVVMTYKRQISSQLRLCALQTIFLGIDLSLESTSFSDLRL